MAVRERSTVGRAGVTRTVRTVCPSVRTSSTPALTVRVGRVTRTALPDARVPATSWVRAAAWPAPGCCWTEVRRRGAV